MSHPILTRAEQLLGAVQSEDMCRQKGAGIRKERMDSFSLGDGKEAVWQMTS